MMASPYQRVQQSLSVNKTPIYVYPSPSFSEDKRIRVESNDYWRLNNLLVNLRFTHVGQQYNPMYEGMFNMRAYDKLQKRIADRRVYQLHTHPLLQKRFEVWDAARQENLKIKELEDYPLADDYFKSNDLWNYQRGGARFAYQAKKCLILDQPGTGKTIEAAAAYQQAVDFDNCKKLLVICPAAVRTNWKMELIKWTKTPEDHIFVADSLSSDDRLLLIMAAKYPSWNGILIINWETIRLPVIKDYLAESNFDMIIADEVHRARSLRTSKQAKSFINITAPRQIGLSGTPVVNKADDLFPLVHWLYPDQYDDQANFQEDFVEDPQRVVRRARAAEPMGEVMKLELDYFTIRRLKKDVLKDLPEKIYSDIAIELYPKQRKLYNKMRDELIIELASGDIVEAPIAIVKLNRLKQIAVSPAAIPAVHDHALSEETLSMDWSAKLDWIIEFLEDSEDKKIVVFSQYDSIIRLLEHRFKKSKELQARGSKYVFACSQKHINGGPNQKDIKVLEQAFWDDPKISCWMGTLKTGGEGINLQCSDTVVLIDLWWNEAMMIQAEDRVHRNGQTNNVTIYNLYAQKTVEQYIQEMIRDKKNVSDTMIDTKSILAMLIRDKQENS